MKTNPFNSRVKAFIKSLISRSQYLMQNRLTKRNPAQINATIRHLNTYLNAYDYNDQQMAKFWIQNIDRVFSLMPGQNSVAYDGLDRKAYELTTQANEILSNFKITRPKV